MVLMCWCLCGAVTIVLEVLEMPARNPFDVFWRSFFKSARVRAGCGTVKSIETFYCMWYEAIQVDLIDIL